MIGPDTIERIRERVSIASVIGESVKLEQRGRSLLGLCPFHKEKTPSFHVSEERGRYHCFGCQASGDVFKFVQETEGLTFVEAVTRLGERAGIVVESDLTDEQQRIEQAARRREQALYDVNLAAAGYFQRMLLDHPLKDHARAELERRGLPLGGPAAEVLESFRIGYAPDGWDELGLFLRKAGLDLRAAETVGLIAPRKQGGGHYDRFRHRLMFAVIDLSGRVVAFSGRALPGGTLGDAEAPAKYINSPESPIYKKRSTVFGLYQARATLRAGGPAILVEGNFDVMTLHAQGLTRAVAPLGTAFTDLQGKAIRRFTSDLVILFDGDRAGREATIKAKEPAKEAGLSARVAQLPDDCDPDDFVRTRGAAPLQAMIASARGMLDHLIAEQLDERFASDDALSRGEKLKRVLELLAAEDDPTVRALAEQHADTLASRLGVADARTFRALKDRVQRALYDKRGSAAGQPGNSESRTTNATDQGPRKYREQFAGGSGRKGEAEITTAIIGAILDFPGLLDSEELLAYSELMQGDLAAVVACLRRTHSSSTAQGLASRGIAGVDLHQALANMPEAVRPFVEARLAAPLHGILDAAKLELSANLRKLEQMEFSRLKTSAVNELERVRRVGDFDLELDLLKQQQDRARKRRGME